MLFAVSWRGSPLIMPRPLLGCQIKAKIKGFLLMYSTYRQKLGEDFAKFCGLLRMYELYLFMVQSDP